MNLRLVLTSTLAALLLPISSRAGAEREGPQANVRVSCDAGYTLPGGLPGFKDGYGLGIGIEIEHAPAVGLLFRVGWDWLTTSRNRYYPYFYYARGSRELTVLNWSVGARGYLRPAAVLSPYGELDVGIRTGEDSELDGVAVTPRLGVAWASFGGPGLALESGVSFSTRDPDRYLIVPIRLGIVFR